MYVDTQSDAPELSPFRYIYDERQIDLMHAIVGGVPRSLCWADVMA